MPFISIGRKNNRLFISLNDNGLSTKMVDSSQLMLHKAVKDAYIERITLPSSTKYFKFYIQQQWDVSEISYCVTWGNGVLEIYMRLHFSGAWTTVIAPRQFSNPLRKCESVCKKPVKIKFCILLCSLLVTTFREVVEKIHNGGAETK